jgi:hypothetical protein
MYYYFYMTDNIYFSYAPKKKKIPATFSKLALQATGFQKEHDDKNEIKPLIICVIIKG